VINCSVQSVRKWIRVYTLVRVQQEERNAYGNTIERRKVESQRDAKRQSLMDLKSVQHGFSKEVKKGKSS